MRRPPCLCRQIARNTSVIPRHSLPLFVLGAHLLAASVSFAAAPAKPREAPSATAPAKQTFADLPNPQRFEFGRALSAAFDIRWDGDSAVLVLRSQTGLFRHRLEKGLPVDGQLLPGPKQIGARIPSLAAFGSSSGLTMASSTGTAIVFSPDAFPQLKAEGYLIENLGGTIADLDVHGSRVAMLGVPTTAVIESGRFRDGIVWVGEVDNRQIGKFEPIWSPGEQTEDARYAMYVHNGSASGSLRFSEDGSLLVALGDREEIIRLTPGGEVKARWHLKDLLGSQEKALGDFVALRKRGFAVDTYNKWIDESSLLIDDVFFIGRSPAVVVRDISASGTRWLLGILTSDGATWHRIPIGSIDSRARLRADAHQGKLVFLAAARITSLFDDESESTVVLTTDSPE
jgi:hypothetical protein